MNPTVAPKGWRRALEDARDNEVSFGSNKWDELANRASEWETCAIGENREQLKKKGYPFDERDDPELIIESSGRYHDHSGLGLEFMYAVEDAHWDTALEILDQIENLPTL